MGVGAGLCVYDVVAEKFTFAISSPGEFLVKSTFDSLWPFNTICTIIQRLFGQNKF